MMEASSAGLAEGRTDMVDFDIAVRSGSSADAATGPKRSLLLTPLSPPHNLALDRARALPAAQVFTNLDRSHLDGHASFDDYREAKGRLFEGLTDAARQRAVVNADDPEAQYFVDRVGAGVPVITYSARTPAEHDPAHPLPDVYPTVIDLSLFDSVLEISTPAGDLQVTSMLLGVPNVANVCAAVAVGCALGISLDVIADGAPPPQAAGTHATFPP